LCLCFFFSCVRLRRLHSFPTRRSSDLRGLALPLAWSVWVLAFFTTSASRLEYYALPAFPALTVIVAAYWRRAIDARPAPAGARVDRKSTRLNSSHVAISYAVFCLKKKK